MRGEAVKERECVALHEVLRDQCALSTNSWTAKRGGHGKDSWNCRVVCSRAGGSWLAAIKGRRENAHSGGGSFNLLLRLPQFVVTVIWRS
jgi:hypothetical protein